MISSTVAAREAVATLVGAGVRTFVLCPGSRSAPLAIALAEAERAGAVRLHVETDERVAGFVALGFGTQNVPTAVVTTSGSAVANLHPAAEEALHAAVPILFLTADRPHDMRGVRASQTTDHLAVLGGSVLHSVDIPTDTPNLRALRNQLMRAVRVALGVGFAGGRGAGPVHINMAFREPLVERTPWESAKADCMTGSTETKTHNANPEQEKRTVVVAGPSRVLASEERAQEFADSLGQIPVLAEPSSLLRALPQAVTAHPLLLSSELGKQIERVVVIGHPTLTREVAALLANEAVEVIVVDDQPTYTDVSGNSARVVDLVDLPAWLSIDIPWYQEWQRASIKARRYLHNAQPQMDFPTVARAISSSDVTTMLGASSIIREVNLYADCPGKVFAANRGLAGIDGTVSTSLGIALASHEPVRVVVGDLTFIHDLGALVRTCGQSESVDLQVVVVDDAGGSLFATLEYGAGEVTTFDRVFRAAKELDFAAFAQAVGEHVSFRRASGNPASLAAEMDAFAGGIEVFVVELGREEMSEMRAKRLEWREQIMDLL
ncbi:2-succinyl-5-enolpyruvyl-6-hydroxy-3-cyclohexene-1-carboxylic-acid synthase [Arcanobacterium bovis]|uniref:2-succinyl-5-enolpyruvyl-6-hydroxy-3-cyclohexene-1-carboxylate synthase n=1 Tax=Arcanobacterium bovis TaxID=2529275 RepID=A0A4V2KR32_9ACTO|nr:2-succinyl-5-enolpyruvyl-6-hydroxy-3-cyclohexene-1-carboxylic-acid synthase [Arcanobacterium bovis]TBW21518.1 2-succinyl-5-enolpyruvyl-6-hydroxy-3-cyclohexene-1-carboxylic-acid synthase [Arcanobacterium bovis]